MSNRIKNELWDKIFSTGDQTLIDAVKLIEWLEDALDKLEHRRCCNAGQVKTLNKKIKGYRKGLKTLSNKKVRLSLDFETYHNNPIEIIKLTEDMKVDPNWQSLEEKVTRQVMLALGVKVSNNA